VRVYHRGVSSQPDTQGSLHEKDFEFKNQIIIEEEKDRDNTLKYWLIG
jgi:hypothetical protein